MIGIIIMTVLSFILSVVLVFADERFSDKTSKYLELLPGYNCGICGYSGCKGMSEAMEIDINNYKKCKPLKGEKLEKMEQFVKSHKE